MFKRKGSLSLIFFLFSLCVTVNARVSVTPGDNLQKLVLFGDIVTPEGLLNGEVVIEGDSITCVKLDCPDPFGATRIRVTNAYIYPGFIDAHNHVV